MGGTGGSVLLGILVKYWFPILVFIIVARLVRNRYHNGLNKYPGPFLASLTDAWRLWDVYCRRPDITHQRLHAKYGDVGFVKVRFFYFRIADVTEKLTNGDQSDFYVVQQSTVRGRNLASLFSTTDNDFHAQFRRCVNAAFAMSALVQYEPFVDNTTKLFLRQTEKLFANNPEGCNFTQWLQFYAFDVIGEITYGKRHGFVEKNKDVDGIVDYLSNLFLYVAPIGQIPWLDRLFQKNPIYLKLSQWGFLDATMPVARFARARMAERLGPNLSGDPKKPLLPVAATANSSDSGSGDDSKKSQDLLSKFLAAQEARPDFMTDTLVLTMAVSMAFAGSETTAISLAAVFYYVLRDARVLTRLRAEIDDAARRGAFSDRTAGLVTWAESQRLPYLDACVKEAFRMHPAAGLPLERIVPSPAGAEIAGHRVPGGTIVGCSAWVIHRRPEIWGPDADVYKPERWLVEDDDAGASTPTARAERERHIREMNGHMFQFGMGSRTCIGKNISLLEIYKVVPSLLRRFEIRFKDPSQQWKLVNAWFVKQLNFQTLFKVRDLVQPDAEHEHDDTSEDEKSAAAVAS
ncbi:hypothetical protein DL762_001953 [Monosporascus cannonballus]|uniref:Ig-like domain-containing protein n=1 Tax=Monosporascus cannonballus TaxID=155416 RepID=A0ABY0HFE3_9PEZI|nr:hypothetical protein DL762_001953 [Monosporascus cannonballus]